MFLAVVVGFLLFGLSLANDDVSPTELFDYTTMLDDIDIDSFNCFQGEDITCSQCISAYTLGCGWCATFEDGDVTKGFCYKVDETNDTVCPAERRTYHDPHLYGDQCCYQFSANCSYCLEEHSYCQYCRDFRLDDGANPEEEAQPVGLCYHADNSDAIDQYCQVPIDRTACCSDFPSNCTACLSESVCSYCYYTGECIYSSTGSSIPEGWCMGGPEEDQSGIVKHCCGGDSCSECYANVVATDHTWNPNSPPCVWCADLNGGVEEIYIEETGETKLITKGSCVPPLAGVCDTLQIDEEAGKDKQMVLLGSQYCDDPCYIGGVDCESCVKKSTSDGKCVWVEDVEYTDVKSEALIPMEKKFCVSGTMSGPSVSTLFFPDYQALKSLDYEGRYYFSTCSMTGDVLLGIIIGVCVFVVVAVIATIIIVSKVRQSRLKKLVKKAEKQADAEIGEMIDIRDPNALFKLWQEEIPWEDDFDNDIADNAVLNDDDNKKGNVENSNKSYGSSSDSSQDSQARML